MRCPGRGWDDSDNSEALPGFWGTGEQGHFFRGTGEQRHKNKGNRVTQAILGNREHRKSRFCFWGTREQGHFFEGNKGTGTRPLRGLQFFDKHTHPEN